jgi:hypothetical protein
LPFLDYLSDSFSDQLASASRRHTKFRVDQDEIDDFTNSIQQVKKRLKAMQE